MSLRKALSLCCLALSLAVPGAAQKTAPQECPQAALQKWLQDCVQRLPVCITPPHWVVQSKDEVLVESGPFLAERIVEECSKTEEGGELPCDAAARRTWLAGCVDEALALVGKTRGEISAPFSIDGGLSTWSEVRYVHSRCPYLKVRVKIHTAVDDEGREDESPKDVITSVEPYLGWPFMD